MVSGLYLIAILFTIISLIRDRKKTLEALKKSLKIFESIVPMLVTVTIIYGIFIVIFNGDLVKELIGEKSGIIGVFLSISLGVITNLSGFIAYPLGENLLNLGAGISQVAGLLCSLMLVDLSTMPLESRYWGRRTTVLRNTFGIILSYIVAVIVGGVLK